jgi:hypothetical protein
MGQYLAAAVVIGSIALIAVRGHHLLQRREYTTANNSLVMRRGAGPVTR